MGFDVEDIDLRKSPPGGWHGTYQNELSHGVNTCNQVQPSSYMEEYMDEPDEECKEELTVFSSARMVHSSIPKDTLFTANGSTPMLGCDAYHDNVVEFEQEEDILARRSGSFSIL